MDLPKQTQRTYMQRVEGVDPDTGELADYLTFATARPPRSQHKDRYTLVFSEGWRQIRDSAALTMTDIRVWAALQTHARIDDSFDATNKSLALELDITRSRVAVALRHLEDEGLITRPRRGEYAPHPATSWCGRSPRRELMKQKMQESE